MSYNKLLETEENVFKAEKNKLDKINQIRKEQTAKQLLSLKEDIRNPKSYIKKPNRFKAFFNKVLFTMLKKF